MKSPQRQRESAKKVLVVDVGGTHVKVYAPRHQAPLRIDSGPAMTPEEMVESVLKARAAGGTMLYHSAIPARSNTGRRFVIQ